MTENLARVLDLSLPTIEITKQLVEACSEARALDTTILDVKEVFDLADYFIVVSGHSDRQVQGITNRVLCALEKLGVKPLSVEGFEEGHWVLIDTGDIVIHVFYEATRDHYDLESLWARAKKVHFDERNSAPRAA